MRLLVDTHIAIWSVLDDPKLGRARELLSDPGCEPFVSAISIWEIAMKHRLARRSAEMPVSGIEALEWLERAGFTILPVLAAHALKAEQLMLPHADPFDRMLLAQALTESMSLVTRDARLGGHGEGVVRV